MGLLDALLGRSKPVKANLDKLFSLPSAQITLEAAEQLLPTGQAGVCFKPAAGGSFGEAEQEFNELLSLDDSGSAAGKQVKAALTESSDEFGYRWIVLESADFDTLVTRAHFVNSALDEHGWSTQLLCSVFGFGPAPRVGSAATAPALATLATGELVSSEALPGAGVTAPGPASLYLVYLYKRGSFYPFVPLDGERRDNEAELRIKAVVGGDLPIEPQLDHWFPMWKLPLR